MIFFGDAIKEFERNGVKYTISACHVVANVQSVYFLTRDVDCDVRNQTELLGVYTSNSTNIDAAIKEMEGWIA